MWLLTLILFTHTVAKTTGDMFDTVVRDRNALMNKELSMMVGSGIELSDSEIKANEIIMDIKLKEVENGFLHPKSFNLSKHFFEYKDAVKDTKLFQILKKMPKGAILHAHDTGILGPDYMLKLTYMDHLYVSFEGDFIQFLFSESIPIASGDSKWMLMNDARYSSGNVEKFDTYLRQHFTMVIDKPEEVYTDVNTVWKKFQNYFIMTGPLVTYKPVWEQYFYDVLKALREDNVMYIEIRSVLPQLYDLKGNYYDTIETAESYKKVTEKFMADYPDFMGAKLIYAPLKLVDSITMKEYVRTAKELKSKFPNFIAGFDLVGQEDLGVPLKGFMSELEEIRKDQDLFLHAGETNWYGTSSDENLFDAFILGAKRIGHAFALVKHPILMEQIKRCGVALELNIISNAVLKLVSDVRNHPAAIFFSQNMPVVVSSDDPGVWEADPLTHDFYVAFVGVASKNADLRMLKQLALNSLYYSSASNKNKMVHEFEKRWTRFIEAVVKEG